jgi:hypothetical protein
MKRFLFWVASWMLALPVCAWGWHHERRILRSGRPLSDSEVEDARALGVGSPERVRVLAVEQVPNPVLWASGLVERLTRYRIFAPAGLTLRYGIFLVRAKGADRDLLVHELVHTMQCERAGGLFTFLRRYIFQCLVDGYAGAEWEREARELSAQIVAGHCP